MNKTALDARALKLADAGGTAFPTYLSPNSVQGGVMAGMTLRQWYAGMALMLLRDRFADGALVPPPQYIAEYVFKVADAMLLEGDK